VLISDIENSIKERLKDKIVDDFDVSKLEVESFPSSFSDYLERFSHPTGAALVSYKGSTFSASQSLGFISQEEKVDFSIILILRGIKIDETYSYVNQVSQFLRGYKIDGCEKIIPSKITFLDEDFGVWIYELEFSLIKTSIEVGLSNDLPTLKSITSESTIKSPEVYL